MAKLSAIYGADDNAFALGIASDALGAPDPDAHSGAPIDMGSKSKGNYQKTSTSLSSEGDGREGQEENTETGKTSNKSDSRAKSKGNS